jgi:hypothetical protein
MTYYTQISLINLDAKEIALFAVLKPHVTQLLKQQLVSWFRIKVRLYISLTDVRCKAFNVSSKLNALEYAVSKSRTEPLERR